MKLQQTKDYLLLIDEEAEINGKETLFIFESDTGLVNTINKEYEKNDFDSKIIAYRKLNSEAKELDLPELPPFEVDIEKLACEKYNLKKGINDYDERYYNSYNVAKAEGFIEGYKAAQSKQFSLEDIERVIEQTIEFMRNKATEFRDCKNIIIQSLSNQKLPKEFISEWTQTPPAIFRENDVPYAILKTITNSEGKKELVGIYRY